MRSFLVPVLLLGAGLYFKGLVDAEHALREKKWTAAALSVGLLTFAALTTDEPDAVSL
jgi:hypothetical protein